MTLCVIAVQSVICNLLLPVTLLSLFGRTRSELQEVQYKNSFTLSLQT